MVAVDTLRELEFFRGLRSSVLQTLADSAKLVELETDALVAKQHDRAIALYVLLSGNVQFLIEVEGSGKLLVGVGRDPGLIIGWSVFRAPFRYMSDVRCESLCRLLRIPHHVIDSLLENDAGSAHVLLRHVNQSLAKRLELERSRLLESDDGTSERPRDLPEPMLQSDPPWTADSLKSSQNMVDFLAHSSLFENMDPRYLDWLAHQAVIQTYSPDGELFKQNSVADHLFFLIDGRVGLSYCEEGGDRCVYLRTMEGVGDVIGWSALVDPRRYRTTAFAVDSTHVVALPGQTLEKLCEQEPAVGVRVLRGILHAISSRLRLSRIRLVARRYGEQVQAIRTLLDQAAETLPVTSPLHKIPYLLENRLTLADAFHTLELTRAHGEPTERSLAELSLEILHTVRHELALYQGLQRAYVAVANAPADLPSEQIRRRSMEAFIDVFEGLSCRVVGEERLPDEPGNIVIMNHLENHMDTMLPNDFRLTLDSHFVSSMILYRRYGQAPIRVVRKPELGWFGYQQYFDRLDYLYVYPGDVDEEDQDLALTREKRNLHFIERATQHLRSGRNLLIAPEGRCSSTENSPGTFRPGAFRLASLADPEPRIVPIAVANFDKRLTRTTTTAIVFQPFRLSDRLAAPNDKQALIDFVNELQRDYRGYVQQAIELADS